MKRAMPFSTAVAALSLLSGCAGALGRDTGAAREARSDAEPSAAEEPGRPTAFVAKSGRVALSSFGLAGRVSWQGLRTVGGAAAGLVTSGASGAKKGWQSGVDTTRAVARAEADNVRNAAR